MRRLLPILGGLAALAALVFGVTLADATAPAVTVEPASAVAYTTAQVSGEVDPGGETTTWRFQYATQAQFEASEWAEAATGPEGTLEGSGLQPVAGELAGLAPGTVYHLRLFAENGGGPAEAVAPTFETEAVALPTVTLEAPTPLSPTTAHLVGHIDPNAPAGPLSPAAEAAFAVAWHFQCTPACPGLEGTLPASSTGEEVSAEATGLIPGASYEVSLVATNAGGTETAGPLSSSSPAAGPVIGETFATEVLSTEAKLGAAIDPGGAATTVHFQYATDEAFTQNVGTTGESASIGSGNTPVAVSARIAGLTPGTTYFYRAVATNSAAPGGVAGPTAQIATPAAPMGPFQLPDDRGYEMVSPLGKANGKIAGDEGISNGGGVQAAADGEAVAYVSTGGFADPQGAPIAEQYLSRREAAADRWTTENITARQNSHTYELGDGTEYRGFSSDLSTGLLSSGGIIDPEGNMVVENPPLAPGAPEGYENDYILDTSAKGLTPMLTSAPAAPAADFQMRLEGATSDLSHVVLSTASPREPNNTVLVEWNRGVDGLEPVSILPGGTGSVDENNRLGGYDGANTENAISADGSTVFWTHEGQSLNARLGGRETVQVDASEVPGEGGGHGQFWTASTDGRYVFFTDKRRLTADSTAVPGEKEDLYEMDMATRRLSDLTAQDPSGGWVRGVLGASDDGSRVYFVAKGVLTGANDEGHAPVAGGDNLYEFVRGATAPTFIATLAEEDEHVSLGSRYDAYDWTFEFARKSVRVAANGQRVVFMSSANLTGYDNRDINTGLPDQEVYLYDATDGRLRCVSCDPTGARPAGPSRIPSAKPFTVAKAIYQSRLLSEDTNRVFFDSRDALVPSDTNQQEDVYEYEDGASHLISTGTSPAPSQFLDASEDGDDAFFVTAQRLVPGDTDSLTDLYDARVGGGFPAAAQLVCQGEGCREAAAAEPSLATPPSTAAGGPGNVRPAKKKSGCSKGKVRKQNKCVKKQKKKAKHHRHSKKRDAKSNRGPAK